jgi:hypothetical protein
MDGDDADGCTDLCQFTCTMDSDCVDTDMCNGAETCDTTTNVCVPGTPVDCSSLDSACSMGMCVPATGMCSEMNIPDGTLCDDGDMCTTDTTCTSGTCCDGAAACTGTYPVCGAGPSCECSDSPESCANGFACTGGACECDADEDCDAMGAECVGGVCDCDGAAGMGAGMGAACTEGQVCAGTSGPSDCTCTGGSCP